MLPNCSHYGACTRFWIQVSMYAFVLQVFVIHQLSVLM